MRSVMRVLSAILLVSTVSGIMWAQTASTGTVLGLVTDPTGGVVPGATVELETPQPKPCAR